MKKKVYSIIIICLLIILFIIYIPKFKQGKTKTIDVSKSVLSIESINEEYINYGSGFVYKVDGENVYIVTNYHVIDNYNEVYVIDNEDKKVRAKVLDYDVKKDIALLSIKTSWDLESLQFDVVYKLQYEDKVYVPDLYSKDSGIKDGIVLGSVEALDEVYGFTPIAISAETDYGSSGSPVLNEEGMVVGMIFLKEKDESDISFMIPGDVVYKFIYGNKK